MADFSQYTGPSADWIALEPTLPPMPNLPILELRALVNKGREELAAHGMASIGMLYEVNMPRFYCNAIHWEQLAPTRHFAS
jgi:hypothetical protein